jgi:hypothetical protein
MTKTEKAEAPWDVQPDREKDITPEIERKLRLGRLREKFPAAAVGKLPRATRQDAKPGKCNECGSWHKLPAVHLDYVGHAEVTDRLLSVDPEWNWAPMALDENGLPRFVRAAGGNPVGLWIKLTVLGMTRLGYGSVDGHAFDAEKQLIGDAIRNSAMRFGVALDLWSKAELESSLEVNGEAVDKKTGEVIAPTSRDEGERMAEEVQAWEPTAPKSQRVVLGIPITINKTWEQVSTVPVSNLNPKSPFAKLSLGELIDEEKDDGRIEYLENEVIRKIEDTWGRMTPKKKAEGLALPYQLALIAFDKLQERRSPPPEFPIMGGSSAV